MDELELLVDQVRQSRKYSSICSAVVRRIAARELAAHPARKEALKATRGRLHQAGGAFLSQQPDYVGWLGLLSAAQGSAEPLRVACRTILANQSSTRERLPILDTFYRTVLAEIDPPHTILDVACGLGPLAIPWMALPADAVYYACDMYADLVAFLNRAFPLLGVRGQAWAGDVAGKWVLAADDAPDLSSPVDLALVLKAIPCLEQADRSAGQRLLDGLPARNVLVSFPLRSLGGAQKGMRRTYEARMDSLVKGRPWQVRRFEFPSELAFLVTR